VPAATNWSAFVGQLRGQSIENEMKQQLGFYMQFSALVFLPLLIFLQLEIGLKIIYMPICLLIGVVLFIVGTRLRES
jgi:hypothetical protein